MAHNLSVVSGSAEMMYVGETPWHKLGTKLDNPATSREAIQAAHLDWQVQQEQVYLQNGALISGVHANVRQDTKACLGIATPKYKILQNEQAFDFFDTVVGEKAAMYHTAGALGNGERIWMLAKLPKNLLVAPNDEVEKYLILVNSHDGKSALRVYFSPIRVVCQNTLSQSLRTQSREITISHRGDIMSKVKAAREVLGLALSYFEEFDDEAKSLVAKNINVQQAEAYFSDVLQFNTSDESEVSKQKINTRNQMLKLFETGKGNSNPAVRHTVWTAYNAVTEYVDHVRTPRGLKADPTRHLKDIWFGTGSQVKDRAYQSALALVA